jgi:cyclohexanone monooxygenase
MTANPPDKARTEFDVAIGGAGFAGMYMLHRLRGLGFTARVIEAGSGVGGTWYWNRYPGARCDIESMQYSYQFDDALQQEWEWSERYSPQPEILTYAEHVADRYDLRPDIQFNTRVKAARYDEAASQWSLETEDGGRTVGRFCVMATGCLSVPNWPKIEGLKRFAGPTYHTALWPHEKVDFTGKQVAVIGTGSSAIQSIPLIAREAAQLYVFQRTPNYSIPAHNAPLDPERVKEIKADYAAMRARAKRTHPGIDRPFNKGDALDAALEERQAEYERRWGRKGASPSWVPMATSCSARRQTTRRRTSCARRSATSSRIRRWRKRCVPRTSSAASGCASTPITTPPITETTSP